MQKYANIPTVIAGFFTGGALAIRGGAKAARNSAIGCACLLAVIEGVGIGFQRMMAENTRLDVCGQHTSYCCPLLTNLLGAITTADSTIRRWKIWHCRHRIIFTFRIKKECVIRPHDILESQLYSFIQGAEGWITCIIL
jgi:hypothetical protein